MIARSRKLTLKNGTQIKTPILVPSFSSKGWKFLGDKENKTSEISQVLEWSTEIITEAVLLSAYDIHHKYYKGPDTLGEFSELTIIDSGGYETSDDHDLSSIYTFPWPSEDWSIDKLNLVIDSLPEYREYAIVSYDHGRIRKKITDQIKDAKDFFSKHINFNSIFLIKPETISQDYIQINNLIKFIKDLRSFDIIGMTEKEIGNSFHDRMHNIATIRKALDNESIDAPIHIFGALDPLATILYFLSGAEIFDGLTWIRYAYHRGMSIYNENYRIIEHGPKMKIGQATPYTLMKNINYLEEMKDEMINFVETNEIESFKYNTETIDSAYKGFISRHRGD